MPPVSRHVARQIVELVGFFVYSFALVAAVTGPSGWPRWLASLACMVGVVMMGWGRGGRVRSDA